MGGHYKHLLLISTGTEALSLTNQKQLLIIVRVIDSDASIGRLLAQRREELGLTQAQLAARMGASQAWITQVETGKREPRWSTLLEFARALEMEPMFVPRTRVRAVHALLLSDDDWPTEPAPLSGGHW